MTRYEHSQFGVLMVCTLFGVAAFVAFMQISSPGSLGVFLIIQAVFLICAILFYKLTIKVDNETMEASFGPGLIRKKVRLAEIAGCERIRIRWWYGWGVHLTPYGWLYNVSGLDAVVIKLRDGRRFALGTDDPDGLTEAIQRHAAVK